MIVLDILATDLPGIAKPGDFIEVKNGIKVRVGGHCANVSINLRRLGIRQGEVSAIGVVGNDIFGDSVENKLAEYGIISHISHVTEAETSKNMILVVKGEDRRFHVDQGANHYIDFKKALEVVKKEKPTLLYIGLAGLSPKIDLEIIKLLRAAHSIGVNTFIDPIKPILYGTEFIEKSIRLIDVLHSNNKESITLTGKRSVENSVNTLQKKGIQLTIVSRGKDGLVAGFKNKLFDMPAFNVEVVDPTGAGDAFCTGIIYGLMKNKRSIVEYEEKDLLDLLIYGSASGAACVTGVGTTEKVRREIINKIIKDQGRALKSRTSIKEF